MMAVAAEDDGETCGRSLALRERARVRGKFLWFAFWRKHRVEWSFCFWVGFLVCSLTPTLSRGERGLSAAPTWKARGLSGCADV